MYHMSNFEHLNHSKLKWQILTLGGGEIFCNSVERVWVPQLYLPMIKYNKTNVLEQTIREIQPNPGSPIL